MRRNRLRDGLVYMQVTRGVARRDHAFPTKPVKPALVLTTKNSKRAERRSRPGHRREEPSRHPLAALRHQDGGVAAQRARQAGGARERRLRGLADRRQGQRDRGRLDQRLDRHQGRRAGHARHRQRASWPASRATRSKIAGGRSAAEARRAAVHPGGGEGGAGSLHHQRHVVRDAGGEDRRRRRSATARSARRRGGCARNMCASRPTARRSREPTGHARSRHAPSCSTGTTRWSTPGRPSSSAITTPSRRWARRRGRPRRCAIGRTARCATPFPRLFGDRVRAKPRRCSTRPSAASISSA